MIINIVELSLILMIIISIIGLFKPIIPQFNGLICNYNLTGHANNSTILMIIASIIGLYKPIIPQFND